MKYVIYCRKSTDSEDRQVMSLDSQERELLNIAEKHNLKVIKTFRESMSAKAEGRPIFNEVMKMIKTGKADAILCWKLDRLARNFIDGGLIIDSLQKGIIKEIRTYESTHLPDETVFLLAMQFGMANQYSRDLSTNVKRGNREKLARGGWPHHAPFGYLNKNKDVIVDPVASEYVIRAFNLYSQGTYGFKELSDKLYQEGLRTHSGKKLFPSRLQHLINNPFYTGVMAKEGKYYQGKHEPLISKELFEMATKVSNDRSRPRAKTLFFPLRGFLRCENCGCSLTACVKKGYHYYYCTNGKGICNEHKSYFREEVLCLEVAKIFDQLKFDKELIEIMYNKAKERLSKSTDYLKSNLTNLTSQLDSFETRENRLLDAFLAEQVSKELYDKKVLEIQNQKVVIQKQIEQLKTKQPNITLERIKEVFLRGNRATAEFLDGDDVKRHDVVSGLLWNVSLKEKKVAQVSLKNYYQMMFNTPKKDDFLTLSGRRDLNPNCMLPKHVCYRYTTPRYLLTCEY